MIDKECDANEYIPGNVHSLKKMICDVCRRETNMAGSSHITDHSICKCCKLKIEEHCRNIDKSTLPEEFFRYIGEKKYFIEINGIYQR